ncbi:S26 family signal peptidase [Sphingopyxis sp.]|uniref:S26 family signal peptidase n=1 Tax=Sphingopyxis sp. TaxID=1908224 RepID=UPI00261EBF07|nr:S26 family signal peptidase [Sphingopyxis sp.]MCW0199892.1 S26 family signal peptidase [Sphingopyxis sp.]
MGERERMHPRRLLGWSLALGGLAGALATTLLIEPRPRLVWNASASAPVGLYAVGDGAALARGDMVIARVPIAFRMLAARRHYLPANVPLVKRVAAASGDKVCAAGARVTVNGRLAARRLDRDGAGRPMPGWSGCALLGDGEFFLLMADSPASFDGRYFGVSEASDIVGKARLLWSR